ncbi:MAG: fumarylacetoacetate hydrolase family protein, partial [Betaproteobacteria bacterium]
MTFAIPAWEIPSVPVAGTADRFPVRHIFCVGRNYAEHAKEMGGDAAKEPPFFFTKPADAILVVVPPDVGTVRYPLATKNYHHEIELVVAIGKAGVELSPERANDIIFGYATGLDMTRRDLQSDLRERKRPWDLGKSFAQSA